MNVFFPYVFTPTGKRVFNPQTEITNTPSSIELENFLSDHFETNSQFSASDLSDIGEDYWELLEAQSEPSNPGVVNALPETRQPVIQAVTTQNPFHNNTASLPPHTPLPVIQSQQEVTDSNGQQPFQKIKRPSRHGLYNQVLTSEQTDDECESTDEHVRKKAKQRIVKRKSRQTMANRLGITLSELYRQQKQAWADRRGLSVSELDRQQKQAQADKRGITVTELRRRKRFRASNVKKSTESPM